VRTAIAREQLGVAQARRMQNDIIQLNQTKMHDHYFIFMFSLAHIE
jgi:hypothetical protein